jgi:uncharacterized protein with HEPN domain
MKRLEISDADRLDHIKVALNFIISHTKGLSEDDFYRNEILKRAVVRDLEVIGEAANSISEKTKEKYPEIQWRQIVTTRNKIIHEYFHVSYVMVWEIIKTDLPLLEIQVDKILSELN